MTMGEPWAPGPAVPTTATSNPRRHTIAVRMTAHERGLLVAEANRLGTQTLSNLIRHILRTYFDHDTTKGG